MTRVGGMIIMAKIADITQWQSSCFVNNLSGVRIPLSALRGGVTVAPVTLDHFVWVRILAPELLANSTTVVQAAVNR